MGPFVEIGQPGLTSSARGTAALDGLIQVGGIAEPKTGLARGDAASKRSLQVSMAPIVSPSQQGIGLVGRW
jgi:hypothetical protein